VECPVLSCRPRPQYDVCVPHFVGTVHVNRMFHKQLVQVPINSGLKNRVRGGFVILNYWSKYFPLFRSRNKITVVLYTGSIGYFALFVLIYWNSSVPIENILSDT
jgi:hypothetical protein